MRAAARLGAGSPRGARARVVYDGRRDPLPRGMRSTDRPTQVLYHVLGYAVDLQVNRASGSEVAEARMVLVGQIVDRYDPARRLAAVAVTLRQGHTVTARSLSNEWGEFHLEYGPREHLRLELALEPEMRIEIPLARFGDGTV